MVERIYYYNIVRTTLLSGGEYIRRYRTNPHLILAPNLAPLFFDAPSLYRILPLDTLCLLFIETFIYYLCYTITYLTY